MNTEIMFSSKTDMWATPQDFFDMLDSEFGFTLDACAVRENAKCAAYYTPQQDGLSQPWPGRVWCNPPYGREIGRWVKKAYETAAGGICRNAAASANRYKMVSRLYLRKIADQIHKRPPEIRRLPKCSTVSQHGSNF
jgi:phage N-6-adenine-methyltransferase